MTNSPAPAKAPIVIPNGIPKEFFGLHVNNLYTEAPWPSMGFGSLRLWDVGVTWRDLEPARDLWDFSRLDQIVDDAESRGIELDLVLAMTPTWASARPTEYSPYGLGAAAEPKDIKDWSNYVRTVATRYKGRIRQWELWNEPNYKIYYTGTIAEQVKLSQEAYTVLKDVDPQNLVISPSSNSGLWTGEYLSAGGASCADVIGFHFYHFPGTPEQLTPYFEGIQKHLKDLGFGDKPVWNTEIGWGQVPASQGTTQTFPDEHEAAAYVARTILLNWSAGIKRMYWYAWNNRTWDTIYLTEADHATPTIAAQAYASVENWIVGGDLKPCSADANGTYSCSLLASDGVQKIIVWNPNGSGSYTMPTGTTSAIAYDLFGGSQLVSGATVTTSISPVLLVPRS